jgi:hypothetical protein
LQTLQALFYFDIYFTALLVVITVLLLLYKLYALGFPKGQFGIEIFVVICFTLLSCMKIHFGMIGNRTEQINCIFLMIFMGVFAGICNLYLILS